MKHKTGYIESPPDERHRPVQQLWGGVAVSEPAQYLNLIQYMDFIEEQANTNSCVWQALGQQHYVALGEQGVTDRTKLSRLFGYYNTRVQHHAENLDLGTIPRQAWTAAKEHGFCSEALWPFEPKKVNRKPDFDAYAGGIDQKWFNGYYMLWGLTGRDSEVRQAISQGHPVIFGTVIDDKFDNFRGGDTLGTPKSAPAGRHMMCGVAYDSDGLWVVNSWGCYDRSTELLTARGWKPVKDVIIGEHVATLNPSGELEYQATTDVQCYPYNGDLWAYQAQGIDLLVTPNHNMFIGRRRRRGTKREPSWERIRADQIDTSHFHMKKTAIWKGEEPSTIRVGAHSVPTALWVEFLGYFLSEGHTTQQVVQRPERIALNGTTGGRKRYRACEEVQYIVGLSQTKPAGIFRIGSCLRRLPFTFWRTPGGWRASSKSLCELLRPLGKAHEKYVPEGVKELSPRLLRIFLRAAVLGDGTPCGRTGSVYYTSSKRFADDIQEIALKAGFCADIVEDDRIGRENSSGIITRHINYQVTIKPVRGAPKPRKGFFPQMVPYSGTVHCVTVPNGLVYVRRNGKAVWCGNSEWGGADPTGKFSGGFFRMGWDWVNWAQATDWWAVRYAKEFAT